MIYNIIIPIVLNKKLSALRASRIWIHLFTNHWRAMPIIICNNWYDFITYKHKNKSPHKTMFILSHINPM